MRLYECTAFSPLSAGLNLSFCVPLRPREEYKLHNVDSSTAQTVIHGHTETNSNMDMHKLVHRTHSLRSHCSMRRWQYWKAFSFKRSFGGSSRLEEEVAETIDTTDPSTSDRSSATCQIRSDHGSVWCPLWSSGYIDWKGFSLWRSKQNLVFSVKKDFPF